MSDIVCADRATRGGGLVIPLAEAIRTHVVPGLHLHFAATPSRSNAAIREVARAFVGTRARFWFSSLGFHSMAHLLPMLGLGDRLIGCFYGDHYPTPRPNSLYQRSAVAGVAIEQWSMWSMVASFRAGAEGEAWAVNRSLRGTTMATELAGRRRRRGPRHHVGSATGGAVERARRPPRRDRHRRARRVLGGDPRPSGCDRVAGAWTIASVTGSQPVQPVQTVALAVAALERDCPWQLAPAAGLGFAAPITRDEARLLEVLDPTGKYRYRAG